MRTTLRKFKQVLHRHRDIWVFHLHHATISFKAPRPTQVALRWMRGTSELDCGSVKTFHKGLWVQSWSAMDLEVLGTVFYTLDGDDKTFLMKESFFRVRFHTNDFWLCS